MTFWAYMLHYRGGYFHVGHTEDLDRCVAQHESGAMAGFTRDHLPVQLVWSEAFQTRDEALEIERKLKGWSRAKKLALIRGGWDRISVLAGTKGRASTGSARTGSGTSRSLLPHPKSLPNAVETVSVEVKFDAGHATIAYRTTGGGVRMPQRVRSERADELWQTTCFELFVRPEGGTGYFEYNFSPSGQWAAYRFDAYRKGMRDLDMAAPVIEAVNDGVRVTLDLPEWVGAARAGLSAVVEERDGTKSYWALAHPSGKPDFHDRACFALEVPAAKRA